MTTDRRRRQLAKEKYERQQARRSQTQAKRRARQRIIAGAVVAVVVVGIVAWIVVGRTSSDPIAAPSIAPSIAPSAGPSAGASAPASTLDCTAPGTPRADTLTYPSAPPAANGAAQVITLNTNCGPISITTLPDKAPKTVGSELFLATKGFYDQTACHRLTTDGIFVLQCGDPKGDGTGGPGYAVPDENLPSADGVNYPAGTVAMANAGPGTAGSQFFIVYQDTTLPPGYTIWGTVTEGLDTVRAIAKAGVAGGAADGAPTQPVFITSAAVAPASGGR